MRATLARVTLRLGVMLCAAAFAACTFRSELPENALVRCGPAGECPRGYRCNTDFDECRRDTANTDALPTLTASLSPSRSARHGAHLTLVVEADRALRSEPRVRMQYPGGSLALTPESTASDFTRTSYGVDLGDELNEGLIVFFGDAISTTGALVTGARLTDLVLDDTAPRLLGGASVTPDHAQKGTRVSVRAEFDEPVRDSLRLVVSRAGEADQRLAPTSNRAGATSFQVPVSDTAADGVASLSLSDVVDEAGNAATGPLLLPPLTIDSTPPVAAPLALEATRFSKQPGHDVLRFTVAFDEPVEDARWCLANRCTSVSAPAAVSVDLATAGLSEGPAPLVVTGRDLAGNVGTRTEFITLDYSPPSLATEPTAVTSARPDCPFRTVSAVGIGGSHSLSFIVDEALGEEPVVNLVPGENPVWQATGAFDGGTAFSFLYRAAGAGSDVSGAVVAHVVDTVGNEGLLTLAPSVRVDLTPPLPLNAAGLAQLRYERVPWGAARTGGVPRFSVECGGCALGSDDVMVFYEEANAASFVLGEARPGPSGGLPRVEFSRSDRQQVWFTRHDEACNPATPVPQPVKQSSWVASSLRPSGSPVNPHTLTQAESSTLPPASSRRGPTLPGPVISLTAHGSWEPRLANPPRVPLLPRSGDELLVADPLRGRTLLLGGNPAAPNQVAVFDGTTWDTMATPSTMTAPTPGLSAVFEAHTGRIIFFAGNATTGLHTWVIDGDTIFELATPQSLALGDYPKLAYDAAGQRVVALRATTSIRTWELGPNGWRDLTPTTPTPPPANDHRFIYDPIGQRLVFMTRPFSGWLTWEFIGSRWRPLAATPYSQSGVVFAFDDRLQALVMMGGIGFTGPATSQTAKLVGDAWVAIPVPSFVPGRSSHELAYDPERRRLVACGGYSGGTSIYTRDCWAFDDSGWRALEAPPAELLTGSASMVFDPASRKLMMVGGNTSDTWLLDGDVWVRRVAPIDFLPRTLPPLAWDPSHGRMLLVGGLATPDGGATIGLNDVWSLSTTTTRLADAPFAPRGQHTMMADPARSRLVLVGGRDAAGTFLPMETWLFDGQWRSLPAPSGMAGRGFASGAADPVTGRLALFGALLPTTAAREVWLFDGTTWVAHPGLPASWNSQRRATLAFDRSRSAFLSFTSSTTGLAADGGAVARTEPWRFDDTTFTPLPTTPSRAVAASSIDPTTGRLVSFGGTVETGTVVAETWTLEGTQWTLQLTPLALTPRTNAIMCFHAMSGQHVLLGGGPTSSTFIDDSWAFGDDGWTRVSVPNGFTARTGLVCAVDETRNVVLALGGSQHADVIEFGLDPRAGPALMFSVDLTNVLPAGATELSLTTSARAAGDSVVVTDPLGGRAFLLPDGGAELLDGGLMPTDGGSLRPSSRPAPGAVLQVWDVGRGSFVTLATTSQTPDAGLGTLSATASPSGDAGTRLSLSGELLRLQVTTLGGSDVTRAPGVRATVVTERPEVELRYVAP